MQPAADLYSSELFRQGRAYAEWTSARWWILSAEHGLLSPDEPIAPYDRTLKKMGRPDRAAWGDRVLSRLLPLLRSGDDVTLLGGEDYRDPLLDQLIAHGVNVRVPLAGLGLGRQISWLQKANDMLRTQALHRVGAYRLLSRVAEVAGGEQLRSASGKGWPKKGVYVVLDPAEPRHEVAAPRVVRVGTHGVSMGSNSTLWQRVRTHRGVSNGHGSHRSSIFRLHVGMALQKAGHCQRSTTWGQGSSASADVRACEVEIERLVSEYLGRLQVIPIAVLDASGPGSDRAFVERNLIALFTGKVGLRDEPSENWLGRYSARPEIVSSGLWNLDHVYSDYDDRLLDVLAELADRTISSWGSGADGEAEAVAPAGWWVPRARRSTQVHLFPEVEE